uniref:Transmembrane protein n=1 Tax=Romanomermis culicivorax TaxID=13658 RepID=A0A915HFV9_ROMCU
MYEEKRIRFCFNMRSTVVLTSSILNLGFNSVVVGRKKGACLGFCGGSLGLFRSLMVSQSMRKAHLGVLNDE